MNIENQCTVLLPVFNSKTYLLRSLANNLATLSAHDELLVIDDGSEDIDAKYLRSLKKLDPRISWITRPHEGLVKSLNFGISKASFELVARADVDDLYDESRISKQKDFLLNNPDVSAVFSDYQVVNTKGHDLGTFPTAVTREFTKLSLINHQRTAHPSVMFRKSAVMDVGGYNPNAFPVEDMDLWIRLSRISNIATIPETLLTYLKNSSGITSRNQSLMKTKSQELTRDLINSLDINEVLLQAQATLATYEELSFSGKRKLLFFRDLLSYQLQSERRNLRTPIGEMFKLRNHLKLSLASDFLALRSERNKRSN
jgi:glycosyltransferase involved in cell wall biosynthesis